MRGEPLHNFIARDVEKTASKFFPFVRSEYRVGRDGVTTYFDTFAQNDSVALAFEVETTARHAVDNAIKAISVGVPIWVIVPNRRLQRQLDRKLNLPELRPGGEDIKILLLRQLEQELRDYLSRLIDKQ